MPTAKRKTAKKGRSAAAKRKTPVKSAPARRPRKPRRSDLLIIECDSQNLAIQGMHWGTAFDQVARALFPDKSIVLVRTSTEDKLRDDLARVFAECGRFRSILIVGHSGPVELELTSDGGRSWATVSQWLKIFEPEFLFLVACEAGQSATVREVFRGIKELRQIYASPILLYKIHTTPIGLLICMLLASGKIDQAQSEALRRVHFIVSGGQLFRWLRREIGPGQELRGRLWDAVSGTLNLGPWDLFEALWPAKPHY